MNESREWELAVDAHDIIGEGPAWDSTGHTLLWVDIAGRLVQRFDPGSGRVWRRAFDQMVGAVLPRSSGGLAVCLQDGVWVTGSDDGEATLLAAIEPDDEATRLNDAKTDRAGRLWGGSMAIDARPNAGSLYRISADGAVDRVASPTTISNGIDWSQDGSLMYYIDTSTHRIDVFDFDLDSGVAADRRPFIELDRSLGLPDGMCVDSEGGIWVAFYDGWTVRRFTSSGALDRSISLPVARVTSCAFGGANLADLYVTSASEGLDRDALAAQPLAGGLFVIRPGVTGTPITPFAG